jgi:hypothetical protein
MPLSSSLRKLAFHKLLRPPSPRSAHLFLFLSVLARTPAGYSSRICSFPTRKPATQPPVLVPQGTVRACRSSECQPIQLSKNLHPEPVRAPSARGTATGGCCTAEVLFFLVWWDLPARLRELAFQLCLN